MTDTWAEKLRQLAEQLGRAPTLEEKLDLSKAHEMTPAEIEAQRQSWVRANEPTGDPRFD